MQSGIHLLPTAATIEPLHAPKIEDPIPQTAMKGITEEDTPKIENSKAEPLTTSAPAEQKTEAESKDALSVKAEEDIA